MKIPHPDRSFERRVLDRVDFDAAHEKAKTILARYAFREEDFLRGPDSPYTPETVQRDLQAVAAIETAAQDWDPGRKKEKQLADIAEAIVIELGELNNWLGENAFLLKTARYDDLVNGVDAIVEFRNQTSPAAPFLGLGIDVTFSTDTTKKFDALKATIARGRMPSVKYFRSEHWHVRGQLENLPTAIVGFDRRTLRELIELWPAGRSQRKQRTEKLTDHRVQAMILLQIKRQMEVLAKYAHGLGREQVAMRYVADLMVIEQIIAQKADLIQRVLPDLKTDLVYSQIMDFLDNWERAIMEGREARPGTAI